MEEWRMEEWNNDGLVKSLKRLFSVIPAPYQVRGKFQQAAGP